MTIIVQKIDSLTFELNEAKKFDGRTESIMDSLKAFEALKQEVEVLKLSEKNGR